MVTDLLGNESPEGLCEGVERRAMAREEIVSAAEKTSAAARTEGRAFISRHRRRNVRAGNPILGCHSLASWCAKCRLEWYRKRTPQARFARIAAAWLRRLFFAKSFP